MSDLARVVNDLFHIPQELCNNCGKCCNLATFKGGLKYEEILELIENPNTNESQAQGAKAYLSVFEPITYEKAVEIDKGFVENVLERHGKKPRELTFFSCKFVTENNLCPIHEDRPLLCRVYPMPHENTFYFKDCGFETKGRENWKKIKEIMDELGIEL